MSSQELEDFVYSLSQFVIPPVDVQTFVFVFPFSKGAVDEGDVLQPAP